MTEASRPRRRRITVNLDDDSYAVLTRLSDANGESMSSIVAGVVAAVSPALGRVAEVIELASTAHGEVLEELRAVTEQGEAALSPIFNSFVSAFDESTQRQLDQLRPPSV